MSGWHGREELLLKVIQMAYDAPDDCEMSRAVFVAMRELMSFASGVFLPVGSDTLELQPGFCFECSPADMGTYLAHYAPLDPFVLRRPGPALLNQTVRLSDVITSGELGRSEFSEFLHLVPYQFSLGILTGLAQQPMAAFGVHRQHHENDFGPDDQAVLDCVGPHLARAIALRRQLKDPAQRAETGILVFGATGRVLYLNTPAHGFLGGTRPEALLAALPKTGSGVVNLASQRFRLNCLPWAAASLLRRFALEEAAADPIDAVHPDAGALPRKSAPTRPGGRGATIVTLQPFCQRVFLTRRLAQYGLSPRQSEIAILALRGIANGEIARKICISEQTVRDHFQEIYYRVVVRSRAELLAKVLGTTGAMATERGERYR
jgi:DNA-binding CsgD family transcriptional regulator